MRIPLVAGNWKMNLLHSQLPNYFANYAQELSSQKMGEETAIEVLIALPAPFLVQAPELARASKVKIAAQTVHEKSTGAFTGEVSIPMLKDLGVYWTLVGHSERRQYYNETDTSVGAKVLACLESKMNPVVCIGETLGEREQGNTESVLRKQLEAVLEQVGKNTNYVVAYEPVWAIGTGLTATENQAQSAHAFIRQLLRIHLGDAAETIRIIYGGSVKSSNIKGLMDQPDIDGALVGGASLDPIEFARIVRASVG